MIVDFEQFKRCIDYIESINKCDIDELELYDKFTKIKIDPIFIKYWKFTGLNNKDYVKSVFFNYEEYLETFKQWEKEDDKC